MSTELNGNSAEAHQLPTIKSYEGFGELVVGRSTDTKILIIALCMLDNPLVNQYLLDNKLRLSDRITKVVVFPREGMSLPDGIFYKENI
jgi:hypothetical protein